MAIATGRVVTDTRCVWLAGGEGRRPRQVVQAASSLARTCSCGAIVLHRACGLWLHAPGRGRAGGFQSMPHEACGRVPVHATCVAVIRTLFFTKRIVSRSIHLKTDRGFIVKNYRDFSVKKFVKAYYDMRRKRIVTVNPTKSIRALLLYIYIYILYILYI